MTSGQRTILVLAAVVFCGVLIARAARKRVGSIARNRQFAARVVAGEDPYSTPIHAPYPPSYGIVMSPLGLVPLRAARILWVVLQLVMLGVLAWVCLRSYDRVAVGRSPPIWLGLAAFVLAFRYFWRDTAGGGGNLVWGALVVLACLRPGEPPGEDDHPWRGLGLGLVLAAKPTPVLFLPWLWWRGRRRTLWVALLTAAVFHAAPILTLGFDGWVAAYERWARGVLAFAMQTDVFADPAFDFPKFTWMHQSLRYALARYLTAVPAEHVIDSAFWFQGLGLSAATAAWITRAVTVALAGSSLVLLWRRRRTDGPWTELAGVSVLICLTLLLSPITWKAHHVQLLPVFFLVLVRITLDRGAARPLAVGLLIYFVACGLLSETVLGKTGKNVMQSLYVVTFGALWLWFVALRVLRIKAD